MNQISTNKEAEEVWPKLDQFAWEGQGSAADNTSSYPVWIFSYYMYKMCRARSWFVYYFELIVYLTGFWGFGVLAC